MLRFHEGQDCNCTNKDARGTWDEQVLHERKYGIKTILIEVPAVTIVWNRQQ